MLTLAVLLLFLQTVVSSAMGVAQVAASGGGDIDFVICSPLSPGGVAKADDNDSDRNVHCPLCRVADVAVIPAALDDVDLGPAYTLELNDVRTTAIVEALMPTAVDPDLVPDRTGPPTGRV